jgi:hypothetical protein
MRHSRSLRLLSAVCTLALLGPAVQGGERAPVKFNNAFIEFSKKLSAAGKKLGQLARPALEGQAADLKQVRKAYAEVEKVLAQVKKEAAALPLPPKSMSAPKLARAYARFLKGQEDMVKKEMREVVGLLDKANPIDAAGQARLLAILRDVAAREQKDLAELHEAQREFAREHDIKLKVLAP